MLRYDFDLRGAAIFDVWPPRSFDSRRPEAACCYLAETGTQGRSACDGEVVAQVAAVVHRHPDKATELYIDEVGVAPAFQRQGIARWMLDEMFAIGRARGCKEAWVGTEHDNVPARRLYESGGSEAEPFVMYVYKL